MDNGFVHAIRDFYESNRRELFAYALSLTRNEEAAEDVVHSAFCRLLKRRRLPVELRPYAFRCVRNATIDLLRRNHRPARESVFELPDSTDPAAALAQRCHADELLEAVSPDERECIVLKLYVGMTFREIAQTRQVPINTAASWYRRGIEKMRALVEEDTT